MTDVKYKEGPSVQWQDLGWELVLTNEVSLTLDIHSGKRGARVRVRVRVSVRMSIPVRVKLLSTS